MQSVRASSLIPRGFVADDAVNDVASFNPPHESKSAGTGIRCTGPRVMP
jgi:hypothetical protein